MLKLKADAWAAPKTWAGLITSTDIQTTRQYTERPVKYVDGVAVVDVSGVLLREEDDVCEYFGAASSVRIGRQITDAVNDTNVNSILLFINSPGGAVNGTAELADLIFAARQKKPVVAYIAGDGYSAGYWLASQADKIVMHEAAGAGAIGVCYPVEIEGEGDDRVVWLVSNVSPNKHPSVDSTDAAVQMQRFLNDLGEIFVSAVARGRGVSTNDVLTKYGQGDIFIAAKAVAAGLADSVGSFETALALAKSGAVKTEIINEPVQTEPAAGDDSTEENETMANEAKKTPSAEMVDTTEITVDWLKQNMPDLYEQIVTEGATNEGERQAALDDMAPANEEEKQAIKAARTDRKMTAEKLAFAFHKKAQAAKAAAIEAERAAREADAAAVVVPVTPSAQIAPANPNADFDAKVIAAMRKKAGIQ